MAARFWLTALAASMMMAGCDRGTATKTGSERNRTVQDPADPLDAARQSIQRGDFAQARKLVQAALLADQTNAAALELAGDLAVTDRNHEQAIEFFQLALAASKHPSTELFDKLGREWMNVGRPFESVATLQSAVKQDPTDPELRQKLVGLQAALGMQREAAEHLQWLVQRGHGGVNLLVILSDLNRPQTVESTCQYALKHFPQDLRPQFSLASLDAYHSKWNDVVSKLEPVVKRHPNFLPAQALYGRAIVEVGDPTAIQQWSASLPEGIESEPQYWLAAGIWSQQQAATESAAHAFWQAVSLNENDGEALHRLSATLAALGRSEDAAAAAQRAAKLAAIRDHVDSLISWKYNSQSAAVKIAKTLEELGRRWEATTWLQAAFKMPQNKDPDLQTTYESIRGQLSGNTPWQLTEQRVAANLDLSQLAEINWQPRAATAPADAVVVSAARVRFQDQAAKRGLKHVCKLGKPPGEEASLAIYQSGGGGAGVIDFDLDGWPDLYLTNLDGTPRKDNSSPNQLHRNIAGRFAVVTGPANVGDRGFAQGIAVGDYNADGFADLLVANIGHDHLYRNNGDGTFSKLTDAAGLVTESWTTSAAIADIDGDGNADIFQVGYCAGDQPLQQKCIDQDLNEPRSCAPLAFAAAEDHTYRGLGDGTFADATDRWLGEHEAGRGFGLIIGSLDQEAGLDVFVANDMTANHYWSRDANAADFRLTEQATVRGLAFNERSLSQASMGIAADDADGDGDIDFLLTHFSGDYNTFYEQVSPGMWADHSHRVGLAAPSDQMLGYGTQWIDADNDGTPELFIANGDIDDFSHQDRFFRQWVQFFDQTADGRWGELNRASLGDYFTRQHLARAVASLDADRDGHTDLVVTHLFDPVALLINHTDTTDKQTRFFVRGTDAHRDAIGTAVTLLVGDRPQTKRLLAGDGFQCSNERCLTFGTGNAAKVKGIKVTWPDGMTAALPELVSGADYLIIQGSNTPFALSDPDAGS